MVLWREGAFIIAPVHFNFGHANALVSEGFLYSFTFNFVVGQRGIAHLFSFSVSTTFHSSFSVFSLHNIFC